MNKKIFKKNNEFRIIESTVEDLDKERFLFGIVPNAPLHIGIDPIFNIVRGFCYKKMKFTLVLADVFSNFNLNSEQKYKMVEYYKTFFKLGCNCDFEAVTHSDLFDNPSYWYIVMNLSKNLSLRLMNNALPNYMRSKSLPLSAYLHILSQTADIRFCRSELVIGFESQRRIYTVARKLLKSRGYSVPNYVLIDQGLDLLGNPMKDSTSKTRISFHDDDATIAKKLTLLAYKNKDILKNIYTQSIFPYVKEYAESILKMDSNQFIENFGSCSEERFEFYRVSAAILLGKRFSIYNDILNKSSSIIDWIDISKVRAESII